MKERSTAPSIQLGHCRHLIYGEMVRKSFETAAIGFYTGIYFLFSVLHSSGDWWTGEVALSVFPAFAFHSLGLWAVERWGKRRTEVSVGYRFLPCRPHAKPWYLIKIAQQRIKCWKRNSNCISLVGARFKDPMASFWPEPGGDTKASIGLWYSAPGWSLRKMEASGREEGCTWWVIGSFLLFHHPAGLTRTRGGVNLKRQADRDRILHEQHEWMLNHEFFSLDSSEKLLN